MSCMATLATRLARRCRSRSSVERLETSKADASATASTFTALSAATGMSTGASAGSSAAGSSAQSDLASGRLGRYAKRGSGATASGSISATAEALEALARPSHGYRADSARRRRNSRARTARQPAPKQPSARAASLAARCSAGWTNTPPRGRRRPDAARPQSAAAAPDCRAAPVKLLLPGPAPEIVGVLSSDSLPFIKIMETGLRGVN